MSLVVLVCLVFGVWLVASAQRPSPQAARLERIGGMMVVAGLIGLGFLLASHSK